MRKDNSVLQDGLAMDEVKELRRSGEEKGGMSAKSPLVDARNENVGDRPGDGGIASLA